MTGVVIAGYGLCHPDGISPAHLLQEALTYTSPPPRRGSADAFASLVGYAGQDAATDYAMRAVSAAGTGIEEVAGERLGVLVASTTSNIDTIIRTAVGIEQESYRTVRPTEVLTIAGTQVTASLSSWFDARAFAYGTCSGTAAGIDALGIARSAVIGMRADRVAVVGVETPGEDTRRMIAEADGERELFTGGAAVIVEASSADNAGLPQLSAVTQGETIEAALRSTDSHPDLVFLPAGTDAERAHAHSYVATIHPGATVIDLTEQLGDAQGALGVLQMVVASEWLRNNPSARALVMAGTLTDRHIVTTFIEGGDRS